MSIGPFQILLILLILLLPSLVVVPTFRKAGWSGWWGVLLVLPVVNLVFLWVFAFSRWPNEPQSAK